jgi:hypothetical protein
MVKIKFIKKMPLGLLVRNKENWRSLFREPQIREKQFCQRVVRSFEAAL